MEKSKAALIESSPVIEVEHLTKDYGFKRGVFDVSIHVNKGEVFGFLGPNGAGKSTTIRHLMGFSKPDSGYVRIFGKDTSKEYDKILNRVGYIPGEIALLSGLTGWEFIRMMQNIDLWQQSMPKKDDYSLMDDYASAIKEWKGKSPSTQIKAVTAAYASACEDLQLFAEQKAKDLGYEKDSVEANEILGSIMYTLNPNGTFNGFYVQNGEAVPLEYDITSIITHIMANDVDVFIHSEERKEYVSDRAEKGAAIFLAGNITEKESTDALLKALSSYGVTAEKYQSFGYTYSSVKNIAETAIVTYKGRLNYELGLIDDLYSEGEISDEAEYLAIVEAKKELLAAEISTSFLSSLPSAVSDALEEIGQADLYTLIVGSIFYKLAGLLLPIIFMIMASNNLIAGQVDSGSMAYVLSTSTKRSSVVFTQALYLIGSLLAMFSFTTVTGCVCLAFVKESVELTYGNLILLNVGAFLVLFALSGLCFFTSCLFDRSKRSMAVGGGLSIFALVAAMLGLFGSPVIPSVVRLVALNNFNYATIISLFDVISIIEGTGAFIWKFVILAVLGIIGYVVGSVIFTKKDLPL